MGWRATVSRSLSCGIGIIEWLCRAKFFAEIGYGTGLSNFAALMCSCTVLKVLAGAADGLSVANPHFDPRRTVRSRTCSCFAPPRPQWRHPLFLCIKSTHVNSPVCMYKIRIYTKDPVGEVAGLHVITHSRCESSWMYPPPWAWLAPSVSASVVGFVFVAWVACSVALMDCTASCGC